MLCKEHGTSPRHLHTLPPRIGEETRHRDVPEGSRLPKHYCFKCEPTPSASSSDAVPAPVRLASAEVAARSASRPPRRSRCGTPITSRQRRDRLRRPPLCRGQPASARVPPRGPGRSRPGRSTGRTPGRGDSAEIGAAKARFLDGQAAAKLAQATYRADRVAGQDPARWRPDGLESLTALNEAQASSPTPSSGSETSASPTSDRARSRTKDTRAARRPAPIDGTVVFAPPRARPSSRRRRVSPSPTPRDVALDRRVRVGHRLGRHGQPVTFIISGAGPMRSRHLRGQGHLGRDRGGPDDPDTRVRAEVANATAGSGPTSSARHRSGSARSTRR